MAKVILCLVKILEELYRGLKIMTLTSTKVFILEKKKKKL